MSAAPSHFPRPANPNRRPHRAGLHLLPSHSSPRLEAEDSRRKRLTHRTPHATVINAVAVIATLYAAVVMIRFLAW